MPAWGAYRGATYNSHGLMRNLVCCDASFRCSPYQPNNVPGGCPYDQACPTLGSADPSSPFHGQRGVDDKGYPQFDEEIRKSSSVRFSGFGSSGVPTGVRGRLGGTRQRTDRLTDSDHPKPQTQHQKEPDWPLPTKGGGYAIIYKVRLRVLLRVLSVGAGHAPRRYRLTPYLLPD